MGDPLRIGQILLNLCSNAVKFTDAGEIVLVAEIEEQDDIGLLIRFSVRDTGIGLSLEQQDKLFQSFSQADTSTTRKYGGTGLGLAICKNLAELMGGEIGVTSEPGLGSTFWFTLRAGRHDESKKNKKSRAELAPKINGKRILIVDDNENALQILQTMTESFGFDVTTASSALQAIDILEETLQDAPFPLVLMDWNMPGMDGIEATRRIKANPALNKVTTMIMISAYGREDLMHQAKAVGIKDFLVKPVNQSVLFNSILEALGHEVARRKPKMKIRSTFRHILMPSGEPEFFWWRITKSTSRWRPSFLRKKAFLFPLQRTAKRRLKRLTASEEGPYEIVLMDLQMPVMDGYEATRAIRKDARFDGLPIIAMTADAMTGVKEKVAETGMNDYVTKPIDPSSLFKALVKWITPGKRTLPDKYLRLQEEAQKENNTLNQNTTIEEDALPDLPDIDVQNGILRVGGNKGRYKKLLMKFAENQGDAADRILMALKAGSKDEAIRLAHTLKGVSGNIGATALHEDAQTVEAMLKSDDEDGWAAAFFQMTETLRRTCQTLQPIWEEKKNRSRMAHGVNHTEPEKHNELDKAALLPLFQKLSQALLEADIESGTILETILPMVSGTPMETALSPIADHVAGYAFEEALDALEALFREFDLSL